jgi:hypothetical protein
MPDEELTYGDAPDVITNRMQNAIQIERDRCAQIADHYAQTTSFLASPREIAQAIADQIREADLDG